MRVLMIALALTALVVLVACGDSAEPVTEDQLEPPVEEIVPVAPEEEPEPPVGEEIMPLAPEEELEPPVEEIVPVALVEPDPPSTEDYVREIPIPPLEFEGLPDDVVLIYQEGYTGYEGSYKHLPIYRIYRQSGELVREELFTRDHPIFLSIEPPSFEPWPNGESWEGRRANDDQIRVISTPDGSRMVMLACHRASCRPDGRGAGTDYDPDVLPLPTTDIYESTDGGVTWAQVDTIDRPWFPRAISDDQLLLTSLNFVGAGWKSNILWPSKEAAPLPDPWGDRATYAAALGELVSSIGGARRSTFPECSPWCFPVGPPACQPSIP